MRLLSTTNCLDNGIDQENYMSSRLYNRFEISKSRILEHY